MIYYIPPDSPAIFPPPELAEADGLLALGGDITVEWLLAAYPKGIFPWYNPGEIIQWWCPKRRFVLFPNEVHISKSMKKFAKTTSLKVKFNENFAEIIAACKNTRLPPSNLSAAEKLLAEMNDNYGTWITDEMEAAFINLFREEYAMCAGAYDGYKLVGGLYGVTIGKCFFGESMFTLTPNASKLAFISLCKKLAAEGYAFIDCQFRTKHLQSLGGRYISWNEYSRLLKQNIYSQ